MTPLASAPSDRAALLERLNQEAAVSADSANDFSLRSWLTSAKRCLDQAEVDLRENDLEAAYVNFLKAISIVVEVVPQHHGRKAIESQKSVEADEYWIVRNRVAIAFETVQKIKSQLCASELSASTSPPGLPQVVSPRTDLRQNLSTAHSSTVTPASANGVNYKIPRKLVPPPSPSPVNGSTSRPASAASSANSSSHISNQLSQTSSETRPTPTDTISTRQTSPLPKANVIEPYSLHSYMSRPEKSRPSILFLDVRPKSRYEKGCINAQNVVWIDPILLDSEKSGKDLEESLVLCPIEQQDWFSNRHLFDLVIIYDEDSRVNLYAGGPVLDVQQVRLRNLTVAIFEYAGYLKSLKHVPMLLIGGIQAWCALVHNSPLRPVNWHNDNISIPEDVPVQRITRKPPTPQPPRTDDPKINEIDLDAESRWIESLHSDRVQLHIATNTDGADQKRLNRSAAISSPSSDPYNKSLLDFFQKFPNVEPESMSGPQNRSRPTSLDDRSRYTVHPSQRAPASVRDSRGPPQRRQSTFIDHPFHGFTEVTNPEFQPPTPSKKSAEPSEATVRPSPSLANGEDEMFSSGRTRIPSIGSQISQVGTVSAGMTGLKNLGNTCYMNSILQCMNATIPLARYFLSGIYRRSINTNNPLGSKGVLATAFAELIKHLWGDQYTHISPVSLRATVGRLQPRFKNSDQQDAQDFLAWFLDGLHEDLNENALKSKLRELTPDEERRRERLPIQEVSTIEWDRYKHNHNSFLVELFQGQLISCLKCSVCGQTSTTCSAFMNLSIEISLPQGSQGLKLTQCIDAFVKEEVLDGDNAWNCPNCKRPQRATKQLRIGKLPTVLIIHLKRFHYAGPWRDKLNTFVDYPMQNLDLTKYVLGDGGRASQPQERYLYDLYAVTNHFGTLSGGHYTACIYNKLREKWFVFDDSRVSPCEDTSVVVRAGYILWYKRNNQF